MELHRYVSPGTQDVMLSVPPVQLKSKKVQIKKKKKKMYSKIFKLKFQNNMFVKNTFGLF